MRTSNKTMLIEKYEVSKAQVTVCTEEFLEVRENKLSRQIDVLIAYKNEHEEIIKQEQKVITGRNYELLMSASPDFAPNKPLNEYREQDLWHVIDMIH